MVDALPRMHTPASTHSSHCIVIPSYNSGGMLQSTLEAVLALEYKVCLVIDGSTDGSDLFLDTPPFNSNPLLRVIRFSKNQGKGAAAISGLQAAENSGFTHAVLFDSDGQHAVCDIPKIVSVSTEHPESMILGTPIFGADAPPERVHARRVANWFTNLSAHGTFIADSLFGFRVYPIGAALAALKGTTRGRAFDFETQIAVRLAWRGVRAINFPTRVTYPERGKGGVSHFHYLRDNALLVRTHASLLFHAFLSSRLASRQRRTSNEGIARQLPSCPTA